MGTNRKAEDFCFGAITVFSASGVAFEGVPFKYGAKMMSPSLTFHLLVEVWKRTLCDVRKGPQRLDVPPQAHGGLVFVVVEACGGVDQTSVFAGTENDFQLCCGRL